MDVEKDKVDGIYDFQAEDLFKECTIKVDARRTGLGFKVVRQRKEYASVRPYT